MATTDTDLADLVRGDPYGDKGVVAYHCDPVPRSASLREVAQTASAITLHLTPDRRQLFLTELRTSNRALPVLRKWWRWAVLCANPELRPNTPEFLRKLAANDESVFDDIAGFPSWDDSSDSG